MILSWDIYELRCDSEALHGVKIRGRIRKFTIENKITCLVENASDEANVVRFAVLAETEATQIFDFLKKLLPTIRMSESLKGVHNPVLSKLIVNDMTRYEI